MNKFIKACNALALLAISAATVILPACSDSDDIEITPAEGFGSQKTVELPADLSATIPEGETTLALIYENGNTPVSVKARHTVRGGKSVLELEHRLRTGAYVLASAICRDDNGVSDDSHVGCRIEVGATQNNVSPSVYSPETSFFGSGTPDDPYLIASSKGLKLIRDIFFDGQTPSHDVCFLQIADIDMTRDYNKGFMPIAPRSAFPFEGCFDGGGHSIYYCAVRTVDGKGANTTDVVPATGLFGYVAAATFKNITMVDPVSMGAGSTGTLIGAVVGISGEDETATVLRNVHVRKETSTASEVYGSDFVGGIVGGVNANAVLMMTGCVNENLPVTGNEYGSFAGGLVGGGTVNAVAVLDSCINRADVVADGSRCAGGIIGGIETGFITDCVNYGNVSAPVSVGVGGIAGGLGSSALSAVVNEGKVTGGCGTGGIVGSTVIRREDGTYNDLMIASAHNYGDVNGDSKTGGIVGESQAMLTDCYNGGAVNCRRGYAGGIIGYAPVCSVNACYNNNSVESFNCTGGIVGRSAYYILTDNANLGVVNTHGPYAGGILGVGGSTGIINFCNNFGQVSGGTAVGGIVAKAGECYSLDLDDIGSMVVNEGKTVWKVANIFRNPPLNLPDLIVMLKKLKSYKKVFTSAADLVKACSSSVQLDDMDYWDSLYEKKLPEKNQELYEKMHSEISASIPSSGFLFPDIELLPGKVYTNMKAFGESLDDEGTDDVYSQTLHDRLQEINEQVVELEEKREIAIAATSCVLAVAGLVVPGAALKTTVIVCSSAVSLVGTLSQRIDNCIEVSQCCNFGSVGGTDEAYGICGAEADHMRLYDCLNAGITPRFGIADKSYSTFDDLDVRATLNVGTCNQNNFHIGNSDAHEGNYFWVPDDYNHNTRDDSGYARASQLSDMTFYNSNCYDFYDNRLWAFLIAPLPAPYNNRYHSFR